MRPRLFQVYATSDFKVYLYYDNGEIRLYDASWIRAESGVFERLHDIESFKDLCTVMNGTLAWDISGRRDPYDCVDICPDTIYNESARVRKDPLEETA